MAKLDREDLKKRLEFSERKRMLLQRMISQRSVEEDTILWSLADLMTLLLIFFILFYSHAMSRTFEGGQKTTEQAPVRMELSAPVDVASRAAAESENTTQARTAVQNDPLDQLRREVMETAAAQGNTDISVRRDKQRLVLTLGERITFAVGEAQLLQNFLPTLERIAGFIANKPGYRVVVAGHTDDSPINTLEFPSNWELSAARAVKVAKFLIVHGVDPHRVSIEGYAAYRPLHDNSTPEERQANRRVEVTLVEERKNGAS